MAMIIGGPLPLSFNSFKTDGADILHMTDCSCFGVADYFVHRKHVDYILTGRRIPIVTVLFAIVFYILYGVITSTETSYNNGSYYSPSTTTVRQPAFLAVGIIFTIVSIIMVIPNRLSIASNGQVFTSTKCCNDYAYLVQWLKEPVNQNTHANDNIIRTVGSAGEVPMTVYSNGMASTSQGLAPPGQVVGQGFHQINNSSTSFNGVIVK